MLRTEAEVAIVAACKGKTVADITVTGDGSVSYGDRVSITTIKFTDGTEIDISTDCDVGYVETTVST